MLTEIKSIRQVSGESFRRWYTDGNVDLIIWVSDVSEILGFQLCLPQSGEQKVITWHKGEGFTFNALDDGEGRPGRPKMSPILIESNTIEIDLALEVFRNIAKDVQGAAFIEARLAEMRNRKTN